MTAKKKRKKYYEQFVNKSCKITTDNINNMVTEEKIINFY